MTNANHAFIVPALNSSIAFGLRATTALLLPLALGLAGAQAQTTWTGPDGGDWDTFTGDSTATANWSGGANPNVYTDLETAVINSSHTLNVSEAVTSGHITIGATGVIINGGGNLTIGDGDENVTIGGGFDLTLSGVTGSADFDVDGAGSLTLGDVSGHTGDIEVEAGITLLSGSHGGTISHTGGVFTLTGTANNINSGVGMDAEGTVNGLFDITTGAVNLTGNLAVNNLTLGTGTSITNVGPATEEDYTITVTGTFDSSGTINSGDDATDSVTVTGGTFRERTGHATAGLGTVSINPDTYISHVATDLHGHANVTDQLTYNYGVGDDGVTTLTANIDANGFNVTTEAVSTGTDAGRLTVADFDLTGIGVLTVNGELDVGDGSDADTVSANSIVVGSAGDIDVAGLATLSSTTTITNGGSVTVLATGDITGTSFINNGSADLNGAATFTTAATGFTNNAGATADVEGTLSADLTNTGAGANFNVTGDLDLTAGTPAGDIANNSGAELNVSGGDLTAGVVTNTSTGGAGDGLGSDGINVSATRTLNATQFVNNGGTVHVAGTIATTAGTATEIHNQSGTMTMAAATGSLDNGNLTNAGTFVVDDGEALNAAIGNVANSGTFRLDDTGSPTGSVTFNMNDTFTQSAGTFTGSAADTTILSINTTGGLGVFDLDGGTFSNIDTVNNGGTFHADGGTFTSVTTFNNTGTFNANGSDTSGIGTFNANSGDVNVTFGNTLSAGTINHNGGTFTVDGTLQGTGSTLNVNAQLDVNESGVIDEAGDININPNGSIVVDADDGVVDAEDGPATIAVAGTLVVDADDDAGGPNVAGLLSLVDGDLVFAESVGPTTGTADITNNGNVSFTGGTVSGIGTFLQSHADATTVINTVSDDDGLDDDSVSAASWDIDNGEVSAFGIINGDMDFANSTRLEVLDSGLADDVDLVINGNVTMTNTARLTNQSGTDIEIDINGDLTMGKSVIELTGGGSMIVYVDELSVQGKYTPPAGVTINALTLSECGEDITMNTAYIQNYNVCLSEPADTDHNTSVNAAGTNFFDGSINYDLSVEGNADDTLQEIGDAELYVDSGSITGVGTFTNSGFVQIGDAGDADATAQDLAANATVNNGRLVIEEGASLTTGTLTNSAGAYISVGVDATLEGTTNTTNNHGTIDVATGGSIVEAGDFINESAGIVNFNGPDGPAAVDMNFAVSGQIQNSNQINFASGSGTTVVTASDGIDEPDDILNNSGGTITVNANAVADASAATIANDGSIDVLTDGELRAEAINNTNDLDSDATLIADINNSGGGDVDAEGTLDGNVTNDGTGSTFDVTADLSNGGGATGTFGNTGGAELNVSGGDLVVSDLTNASAGSVGTGLGNEGVNISATRTLTTATVTNSGSGTIHNAGTLEATTADPAAISITGGRLTSTGTIDGNMTNNATAEMEGILDGDVVNSGGSGLFDVTAGLSGTGATATGSFSNESGARLAVRGGNMIAGDVTNTSGGSGTSVSTAGVGVSGGRTLTVDSFLNGGGTVHIDGILTGALVAADEFDNRAGSTTIVDGTLNALTTNAGSMTVNGTVSRNISSSGSLTLSGADVAGVTNTGTGVLDITGSSFGGNLSSAGSVIQDGTTDLDGNDLTLSGGTFDMQDGSANDLVNNIGALSTTTAETVVSVDVDRSGGGISDTFDVAGFVAGGGTLRLDVSQTGDATNDFLAIFDGVDALALSDAVVGTDILMNSFQTGNRVTVLVKDAVTGDIGTQVTIATSAASSVSAVTMSESILNVVVNRPSSPFVTGLAFEDENPCSTGTWARATGGQASVENGSRSQIGSDPEVVAPRNTVEATFTGVHGGVDFGCFDDRFGGWNLAGGAIVGLNSGSTSQDNLEIGVPFPVTRTTSTYQQTYAGAYVVGVRDNLAIDLQARAEATDYSLSNVALLDPLDPDYFEPWDLDDTPFQTTGYTISGGLQYFITLNEERGTILVPNAGFGVTRTSSEELVLGGDDNVTVTPHDRETRMSFFGATLAQQKINDDGVSATTRFATVTFYNDMSDPALTDYADDSNTGLITTDPIGSFGEASAGWSYIKILDPGQERAARQFNASVRIDARFSEDVEAIGVTGQVRLQF